MTEASNRRRAAIGPALLAHGFRPFFLGACLWAVAAMALWLAMLNGRAALPTSFDPVSWHAHEFLFGYLGAVVAGFLLTAIPNWTGRQPVHGWPLGILFVLWIAGRGAIAVSTWLPPFLVAAVDLLFLVALAGVVGREIVRSGNCRNLVVLGLLCGLIVANAAFHWEAALGLYAASSVGLRLGLAAGIMMVALIGGRIVPSFTRNWLVARGDPFLPALPMQRLDTLALAVLALALAFWTIAPDRAATALVLLIAGILHLWRLARWGGHRTRAEPLVAVLHLGYAFVPAGALALGAAILWPAAVDVTAAQHLWMAGALGLMTLAVMTRATLGHTGRRLTADAGTVAIYVFLLLSVLARVLAGQVPATEPMLNSLSGLAWIAAFGQFSLRFGPLLMKSDPQD